MNTLRRIVCLVSAMIVIAVVSAQGDVRLPQFFSDGMVVQRDTPIPVWGWAEPGTKVAVTIGGRTQSAKADSRGEWRVSMPQMAAGGPYAISINGTERVKDVLVGDVFLFSGQSNQELPIRRCMDRVADLVKDYDNDRVRVLKIPHQFDYVTPQRDCKSAPWMSIRSNACSEMPALSYFVGRALQDSVGVPIGIINCSVGGTRVECWMSAHNLGRFDEYKQELAQRKYHFAGWVDSVRQAETRAAAEWDRALSASDAIERRWNTPDYDYTSWNSVSLFDDWSQGKNGCYWFHNTITLTREQIASATQALLRLGAMKDADDVYVNGKHVGSTSYEYPPRNYRFDTSLLHEGKNDVVIRLVSQSGAPNFTRGKQYQLEIGSSVIPLERGWRIAIGTQCQPRPQQTYFVDTPTGLFNAMISPFVGTPIKGMVWYQGESNIGSTAHYADYLAAMIEEWRTLFPSADAKHPWHAVIVQLPAYMQHHDAPYESGWCQIREQQRLAAMRLSGATLAPTLDTGEFNDIHPQDKNVAGHRVASILLSEVYGREAHASAAGPRPVSATVHAGDHRLIVQFDPAGGALRPFCDEYAATISQHTVAIDMDAVVRGFTSLYSIKNGQLRYAYDDFPHLSIYNKVGVPAPQFTIDITEAQADAIHDDGGHNLWLKYERNASPAVVTISGKKTATMNIAADEVRNYWHGSEVVRLVVNSAAARGSQTQQGEGRAASADGYSITVGKGDITVTAATDLGVLYGVYALLRMQQMEEPITDISDSPRAAVRILNHWDNPNGTVERGYAGRSIFFPTFDAAIIKEYARANASIGINATVLNNVNAKPEMLSAEKLSEVRKIADILRPYGIRVYLSVNFASPKALCGLATADPLDETVRRWWKDKCREIYRIIPDFGGFLVKANSEGEPGPMDYGRTHVDGANMLAEALKPFHGTVMWRAFVYSASNPDRANQAYDEFMPFDGKFMDNVIIQIKNGPIDFQPREATSPLFYGLQSTRMMPEFQITQEYLGESIHTAFLATMWQEFFASLSMPFTHIAGVANIGDMHDWCGSETAQANWYAFGRMAWDSTLSPDVIAREWLGQTYSAQPGFVEPASRLMLSSRETVVRYMMPLGLHHIFAGGHHYGPEPWCAPDGWREDWLPRYYHKADTLGIGFDRTIGTGSANTGRYPAPLRDMYDNIDTCPENLLLWFHHVPWTHTMRNGDTLWDALCHTYDRGVREAESFVNIWRQLYLYMPTNVHARQLNNFSSQASEAWWWRDACLLYFQTFSRMPLPLDSPLPRHRLSDLLRFKLDMDNYTRADTERLP